MLWVVALSEEFFFRGVLQRQLSRLLANETAAVLIASVLFGLAHLPFRQFPNWRFALVAATAGFFYGRAFSRAGNIRAAMVTHALVNTTTRMLFA
jgi:membrane protease YdiL (CAAX protease family)